MSQFPYSELHAALLAYRDSIQESYPDALQGKIEAYLTGWCSQETRWLHRFLEAGRTEPVYQLTPHTEDALAFLDRMLQQDFGFVGTESRLRLVIETLADLVIGASDDPEIRLSHLRSEKLRIEQEIAQIEAEGVVKRYQPVQIRERFSTAVSLLKHLQGDFRAVEEKFKDITQQVQKRQSEGRDTRGGILEFALDAEDVLKREDQGVSFYEFVRFILSPTQQEKLQTIIQQLNQIAELAEQTEGLETVGRMVPMLLEEARKVMRTNQRLSTTLRRLLDRGAQHDRQRVGQLCRDILGLAASMASYPPRSSVAVEVETRIMMISPFARTFWSEPHRFAAVDMTEHVLADGRKAEAFRTLAEMHRLDWRRMRQQVRLSVAQHGMVTLPTSKNGMRGPTSRGLLAVSAERRTTGRTRSFCVLPVQNFIRQFSPALLTKTATTRLTQYSPSVPTEYSSCIMQVWQNDRNIHMGSNVLRFAIGPPTLRRTKLRNV